MMIYNIFALLLSCSEIKMFEEGILGGNGTVSIPKCEATQIYLLAENLEQAHPKSSKLNTSENIH